MKLSRLCEDWDKAVGVARSLRADIDRQLKRTPVKGDKDRLFHVGVILANSSGKLDDLTPEESSAVFEMLGNAFGVPGKTINKAYEDQRAAVAGDVAAGINRDANFTPQDWLHNYARHQGIPITNQPAKEIKEPSAGASATQHDTVPLGQLEGLSIKTIVKLERSGINTIGDVLGHGIGNLRDDPGLSRVEIQELVNALAELDPHLVESKARRKAQSLARAQTPARCSIPRMEGQAPFTKLLDEMLYGHHVSRGTKPIDGFIEGLESLYLEPDLNDPRVQALLKRWYGRSMPTLDKLVKDIEGSAQSPELKTVLVKLFQGGRTPEHMQPRAQRPAAGGRAAQAAGRMPRQGFQVPQGYTVRPALQQMPAGRIRPYMLEMPQELQNIPAPYKGINQAPPTAAIVEMKRGTVISVEDLKVVDAGDFGNAKPRGNLVIAGIGALAGAKPGSPRGSRPACPHPNFFIVQWKYVNGHGRCVVARRYNKILTIRPHNIAKITLANGQAIVLP